MVSQQNILDTVAIALSNDCSGLRDIFHSDYDSMDHLKYFLKATIPKTAKIEKISSAKIIIRNFPVKKFEEPIFANYLPFATWCFIIAICDGDLDNAFSKSCYNIFDSVIFF